MRSHLPKALVAAFAIFLGIPSLWAAELKVKGIGSEMLKRLRARFYVP